MTKTKHNRVFSINEETGDVSVGILPANGDTRVWVDREAYDRILAEVGEVAWFLNDNGHGRTYVRLRHPERQNLHMVARLVTGEQPGRIIRYNDGNPLNLRRANLTPTRPLKGMRRARKTVPDEFAPATLF